VLISIAVIVYHDAFSFFLAVDVIPLINGPIGPQVRASAFLFPLFPIAIISVLVTERKDALPVPLAVDEASLVFGSIYVRHDPEPMFFAVSPVTLVLVPVCVDHAAAAVPMVIFPFPLVAVSIGPAVSATSVLDFVFIKHSLRPDIFTEIEPVMELPVAVVGGVFRLLLFLKTPPFFAKNPPQSLVFR